jgi:dCTP deaminase
VAVLSDRTITELCTNGDHRPLIKPFILESISKSENGVGIASYGLSSYGYDIRCAPEFKVFKGVPVDGILDYKKLDTALFESIEAESIVIPPNGFILSRSIEYIVMPENIMALCVGKSTIARAGINCLCTPIEPGWEGHVTLEFSNTTSLPNRFYANEGVLQLIFFQGDRTCKTSYKARKGKYQNQPPEIVLPKV